MNRIQWLIVFLTLVPLFLYAYLGQFSRIIADDDCIILHGQRYGAWDAALKWYNTDGGRYAEFLFWGITAPLDTLLPRIILPFMILLWLAGWVWLVFQGLAFLKIGNSRPALSIAIAALTVAAVNNAFYTWESRYWYGAVVGHTMPIVLFPVYMGLTVWMAPRLRKNIRSILGLIAGAAICFLVAGFSEAHVVFQLIFLAFCLLMSFALLESSVRYRYVLVFGVGWLATLASLIVQWTAPGVAARMANEAIRYSGIQDRSLGVLVSKTLTRVFSYIKDPEVFAGFIMLMAVALLVALVTYKPPALSKAPKPLGLTLPALWLGLIFHLLCLPLLWLHTSDNPQFLGRFSSRYMILILLNILFILGFLVMLWQRKRINAQLQKREPGRLFPLWFMAAALIFALLFALTQIETLYFYSSIYLFTSALVFLAILTSLYTNAEERKFGLLAFCSYGLGWVSILAVVFMLTFASDAAPRTMAVGACLLTLSGLVWGAYIGYLSKRYLPSLQAGQAWIRFLKLGSLVIVLIIAVNIVLGQVALIPDYQNFAQVWDANHQKIITLRDSGQDVIEVSPLPLYNRYYLGGCPGRYYGAEIVIDDGSFKDPAD